MAEESTRSAATVAAALTFAELNLVEEQTRRDSISSTLTDATGRGSDDSSELTRSPGFVEINHLTSSSASVLDSEVSSVTGPGHTGPNGQLDGRRFNGDGCRIVYATSTEILEKNYNPYSLVSKENVDTRAQPALDSKGTVRPDGHQERLFCPTSRSGIFPPSFPLPTNIPVTCLQAGQAQVPGTPPLMATPHVWSTAAGPVVASSITSAVSTPQHDVDWRGWPERNHGDHVDGMWYRHQGRLRSSGMTESQSGGLVDTAGCPGSAFQAPLSPVTQQPLVIDVQLPERSPVNYQVAFSPMGNVLEQQAVPQAGLATNNPPTTGQLQEWPSLLPAIAQEIPRPFPARVKRTPCKCPNCQNGEGKTITTANGQKRKVHVCDYPGEKGRGGGGRGDGKGGEEYGG